MPPLFLREQKWRGQLKVIIHSLDGTAADHTPNFQNSEMELVVYVAIALTRLTNGVWKRTRPDDWKILEFDQKNGILEIQQLYGEPLIFD
jgi:hypothetical protein